jgi:SAM-dependent methyltransferase
VTDQNKQEKIGKVTLDYQYYSGQDLYSDGDDIENRILDIVKTTPDYEHSREIFSSWPVLYHLIRQRENIAIPMDIGRKDSVLEIGAGMGAVTGAFAKRAGSVDCIELSKRRSMINAWRHKDLDGIRIMVGNFKDIVITEKYDAVMLIGVLEYAENYVGGEDPYHEMLKKAASCLKEGGRVYIAIENRLGMKYFSGYHEDHLGKAFAGIEGYTKEDKVRTFSKSELEKLVSESGFGSLKFYYPMPDYKLPSAIYDESTFRDAHLEFSEYTNYDKDILHLFSQVRALESLRGSAEREIFANSFLVEAKRSAK